MMLHLLLIDIFIIIAIISQTALRVSWPVYNIAVT